MKSDSRKVACYQRVLAEREGFEPSMDGTAHTGFRDRKPLRQKVRIYRSFLLPLTRVGNNLGKKRIPAVYAQVADT
jgi:hypothetical protein